MPSDRHTHGDHDHDHAAVTPEELAHPESLAGQPRSAPSDDGLWTAQRRPLTLGLVLTITLVAAEALAVSTAMPIVARELGGLELYGLVFTAFLVGSLLSIVVAGTLIDRRGVVLPFLLGHRPVRGGARDRRRGDIDGDAHRRRGSSRASGAGPCPPIAYVAIGRTLPEHLRPGMFATLSTAWVLPGVLGPGLAGIVAEAFNWRWIFFGLLPLLAFSGFDGVPGTRGHGPAASIGRPATRDARRRR